MFNSIVFLASTIFKLIKDIQYFWVYFQGFFCTEALIHNIFPILDHIYCQKGPNITQNHNPHINLENSSKYRFFFRNRIFFFLFILQFYFIFKEIPSLKFCFSPKFY